MSNDHQPSPWPFVLLLLSGALCVLGLAVMVLVIIWKG